MRLSERVRILNQEILDDQEKSKIFISEKVLIQTA